jgi:hypothetical protein
VMLKVMDGLKIFDRSYDIPPFLLLGGHGSRCVLPFLQYITCKEQEEKVCIGVPCGTSYWQVGDSMEQNGCFKMSLTKAKINLVEKKESWGLEGTVDKTDIVVVFTYAWEKSYNRNGSNKKAVPECGWGPLNYNLLLQPEISGENRNVVMLSSDVSPEELNLMQGLSGTLTNKIVMF